MPGFPVAKCHVLKSNVTRLRKQTPIVEASLTQQKKRKSDENVGQLADTKQPN